MLRTIVDTHTTVPRPDTPDAKLDPILSKSTKSGLLERMDKLGIDRAVLWYIGLDYEETVVNNNWIASLVRRHPDRLIGFTCVYPLDVDGALKELKRCIDLPEFKGLKMHPSVQNFKMNDPSVLRVVREAKEYNIPLVLHVTTAASEPLTAAEARRIQQQRDESEEGHLSASKWLWDVIKTYNSPKVIAAHMGGLYEPRIQESTITFQTTGACTEAIEYAYETVGAERVIFGSDFPFFEISDEIAKIRKAKIPSAAKKKILGDNAEKLLKLT